MEEIIKKILALPVWTETDLQEIKKFLDCKEMGNFQDGSTTIQGHQYNKIIHYLHDWESITKDLKRWSHSLTQVWKLFSSNPFASDETITIMIDLLPDDISILNQLKEKLELPTRIKPMHRCANLATNLYVAISAKIDELSKSVKPSISFITYELIKQEEIKNLRMQCEELQNVIIDKFENLLQHQNQQAHYYYFCSKSDRKISVINKIINQLEKNKSLFFETDEIKDIKLIFLMLSDMIVTLDRHESSEVKLDEFYQKFMLLRDNIKIPDKHSYFNLQNYLGLSRPASEATFIHNVGLFASKYTANKPVSVFNAIVYKK